MKATTFLKIAREYQSRGYRFDMAEAWQLYLDAAGKPCGKGWISARKKCSQENNAYTKANRQGDRDKAAQRLREARKLKSYAKRKMTRPQIEAEEAAKKVNGQKGDPLSKKAAERKAKIEARKKRAAEQEQQRKADLVKIGEMKSRVLAADSEPRPKVKQDKFEEKFSKKNGVDKRNHPELEADGYLPRGTAGNKTKYETIAQMKSIMRDRELPDDHWVIAKGGKGFVLYEKARPPLDKAAVEKMSTAEISEARSIAMEESRSKGRDVPNYGEPGYEEKQRIYYEAADTEDAINRAYRHKLYLQNYPRRDSLRLLVFPNRIPPRRTAA